MGNPVIIVTGAAGGIGYEIVRILLEDLSASVVATDIVEGPLPKLSQQYQGRLHVIAGDIVDPKVSKQLVATAIKEFGKLDGVCLNAGVFGPCYSMAESSTEEWSKGLDINVLSHLSTLKFAVPELRKTKGRVTATTSGAGQAALFTGWGFYGMSKAAVSFLVKQLAMEEPDITVVGIAPGLCNTKMIDGLLAGKYDGWGPEQVAKYKKFVDAVEMITPSVAGAAYAHAVVNVDMSLSGSDVEYNDPRLPIPDHLKRKDLAIDYAKHSRDANASAS